MITNKIDSLDKKARETADRAYDNFDSTRQDAREVADQAVEAGQQGFRQAKDAANKAWNQARITGSEWGDRLVEASEDNLDTVKSFVQSRPIQTAAIALAVGVIIGGLLAAKYQQD